MYQSGRCWSPFPSPHCRRLQEFEVLGFRGDPKPVPGWESGSADGLHPETDYKYTIIDIMKYTYKWIYIYISYYIYMYKYVYIYIWYTCAVCIRTIGYHRYVEVVSCFLVVKFVWHAEPFSISQDPYVCESNIVPNLGRPAGEQPGTVMPFFYGRPVGTKPWIMTSQEFSRTLGSFFSFTLW